ncbi:MAG: type II toxin-antitoxin system Phd/YefM family antitoxin [Deltaproteobacteria bacterium]|nr:type II toxin-antitoxin system Phd/YefM family antitoxin [Deltaproteobacteria bacterium]
MGRPVNVHAAKTNFSKLLARVEKGQVITIARAGVPVAELRPLGHPTARRRIGALKGRIEVAPDFNAPLPPEILAGFEGG